MKPSPPFLSSASPAALISLRHVVLRREMRSMRTDVRDHYLGYLRGDDLLGLIPLS